MKTALISVVLLSIFGATAAMADSPKKRRVRQPPAIDAPKLAYSVMEGCAALGISRPTMYALIERGELRTVLVGRRRLIPATELDRLLSASA